METKGMILASKRFKASLPEFIEYEKLVQGQFLSVMDIAVDGSSYLCITDRGIVDVERRFALIFVPFAKTSDGLLMPCDMSEEQKLIFRGKMMLDGIYTKQPVEQLQWIYEHYPEYWEREAKGEFYPNGLYPHTMAEMAELLKKKTDKI